MLLTAKVPSAMIWRDIWQVHMAYCRFLVPSEHGVNSLRQLSGIRLVDTACIYPYMLQSISFGLFSAEFDLLKPIFRDRSPIEDVLVRDFICRLAPSMRQDSVSGDSVVAEVRSECQAAVVTDLEETHFETCYEARVSSDVFERIRE